MINIKEHIKNLFREDLFRSAQQTVNHRVFDLPECHPLKSRFEVFITIIEDFLESRQTIYRTNGINTIDYNNTSILKYVYDMCMKIQHEFNGDVSLDEIISLDSECAGHVDYCYKFALRLAELESTKSNEIAS